ncbi:hypothetical protein BDQ17DRAFT_1332185 [Cyathus striatus]|nr:hypothetical protein BDQ17DRAFT_1332185 [Cyathus striatus]
MTKCSKVIIIGGVVASVGASQSILCTYKVCDSVGKRLLESRRHYKRMPDVDDICRLHITSLRDKRSLGYQGNITIGLGAHDNPGRMALGIYSEFKIKTYRYPDIGALGRIQTWNEGPTS